MTELFLERFFQSKKGILSFATTPIDLVISILTEKKEVLFLDQDILVRSGKGFYHADCHLIGVDQKMSVWLRLYYKEKLK